MRILVTGGAGFIGSHLTDALINKGHEVFVFDNLEPQIHASKLIPFYLNKKANFIRGDVRNKLALKTALREIDVVYHLAAAVGIAQSMYQVKKYVDVNIGGTANLMDIIVNSKNKVRKVIAPGSATSYGECSYECKNCGLVYPPLREKDRVESGKWEPQCPKCGSDIKLVGIKEDKPFDCRFVYALNKQWQEQLIMSLGKTYDIPVSILRLFNVYGPRQSLSNPYTGVIAVFTARLKENKPPIVIEDGMESRDFVNVKDVVGAFVLCLEKREANFEVFNVGSGKSTKIVDLAKILIKLFGKNFEPEINYIFRKGDVRHSLADISKIKEKLRWFPKVGLENGLREVYEWGLKQESKDNFESSLKELSHRKLV